MQSCSTLNKGDTVLYVYYKSVRMTQKRVRSSADSRQRCEGRSLNGWLMCKSMQTVGALCVFPQSVEWWSRVRRIHVHHVHKCPRVSHVQNADFEIQTRPMLRFLYSVRSLREKLLVHEGPFRSFSRRLPPDTSKSHRRCQKGRAALCLCRSKRERERAPVQSTRAPSLRSARPPPRSPSSLARRSDVRLASAMTHSKSGSGLRRRKPASTSESSEIASPTTSSATDDPSGKLKAAAAPTLVSPPLLSVHSSWADWLICTVLLLAALAVRFYQLAKIDSVIFDEVHYLNFGNYVLTNKYFFDVNPVFGKMAVAYLGKALGYVPDIHFESLGQHVPAAQVFAARAPAALFGALTVPVFYRVCRLLRLSTYASLMGAFCILFDIMHVIQSRIVMVDSVLVFFTCFAFYHALLLWDAKNVVLIKGRHVTVADTATVLLYLIVTGVCCGLSVSVRWTAFATPALIFTVSLYGVGPFCMEPLNLLELLLLYGSALLSYCGSFAVFLLNMTESGPGDGFMTPEFQKCLTGSKLYEGPGGCTLSMWARIVEVNKTIFRYSKGIRGNDKWGSSWFQWIVNWRGALYYRHSAGEGATDKVSLIYVLMNPVMALCIDGFMGLFIAALFYTVRYRKQLRTTEAFKQHLRRGSALFFGWMGSMLPTMVVYRSGPVYQYLPGLFFAQALGAVGFDLIPRKLRPMAFVGIAAGIISAFVYWSPWVYGIPLTQAEHMQRRWLPRWD